MPQKLDVGAMSGRATQASVERIVVGGGEMGERMRAFAWDQTPLGPIDGWPQSLRSAVSILLPSRAQIVLFWGSDLITIYNDAYRPVYGAKHPAALGQPARESWREVWDVIQPLFDGVMRTGEAFWAKDHPFYLERHGYSEETYFDVSYDPVRDESGGVGGVFCIVSETTGRVLGERRLRTLRDLGVELVSNSDLKICADAATILGHNSADVPFARFFLLDDGGRFARLAATTGEVTGSDAGDAIDLQSSLSAATVFREVLKTGRTQKTTPNDFVNALPASASRDDALAIPLFSGSQIVGILVAGVSRHLALTGHYRDFFELVGGGVSTALTNRRAYEEERRRADALRELDRAKTAFFSNVSHEFRTPLTLLLGPLNDAIEDSAERPPRDVERLKMMQRNALRLAKLVNTMLDFSRIEAGRVQASYQPVELAALTKEIASAFQPLTEAAGLRFRVDAEPLSEPIHVDPEMWEKIVLNLLSNAFKFTFEGEIFVSLRAHQRHAELVVRDTGTGIPAQELPRLFERFYRVPNARGRTHEGTGIGLALVDELVRLHGGKIDVQSSVGEGTTFVVSIPMGDAHLPANRPPAAPRYEPLVRGSAAYVEEAARWAEAPDATPLPVAAPGGRILVADDNADMRGYLGRVLGPRFELTMVQDGRAALEAARAGDFDLVLTDVMMPWLDGYQLLRELRQDAKTADLPVIMLSAQAGDEARAGGLEAGADDYVVKPFSPRELLARVSTQLNLRKLGRRLAQERAAISKLFTHMPLPVAVFRGPQLIADFVNPAYEAGVAGRGILGRPLLDALPELGAQGFGEQLLEVMRTGVPRTGREAVLELERDGKRELTFWTFIYAPLFGESGESNSVIAICEEVTEQVRARHALQQAGDEERRLRAVSEELLARERAARAEADAASRAKDEFLAMLGHELRNPLAPILTALQLLELRDEGTTKELTIIDRQVRHLMRLVDDLLDVSRITRGKVNLRRDPLRLSDIVAKAVEMVSPLLESRQHYVTVSIPKHGMRLEGDEARLIQVFVNLLTNAAKYTAPRGRISLSAVRDGHDIEVRVTDTGIGIAPVLLPQVFDLFTQGARGMDRGEGGLGLGLAIVQSLVQLHGGTAAALSDGPGRGSEFVVRLPALDVTDVASSPAAAGAAPVPLVPDVSRRVLVVDDNEDAAGILAQLLRLSGHVARIAYDGPQALELVESFEPDVAILDIGLPVMDGYELAAKLRARFADLWMIALTGYGQDHDRVRSSDAGFSVHLVKPVNADLLVQLISRKTDAAP